MTDHCIICLDNIATSYILKCGHHCYCDECIFINFINIKKIENCPICRQKIDDFYISSNTVKLMIDIINNKKKIQPIHPIKNIKFDFGKYRGLKMSDIYKKDGYQGLSYIKWIRDKYIKQQDDLIHMNKFLKLYHYH